MDRKVKLCCGRRKCPVLKKTEYGYSISDDFGGEVKLKKDELEVLIDTVCGEK